MAALLATTWEGGGEGGKGRVVGERQVQQERSQPHGRGCTSEKDRFELPPQTFAGLSTATAGADVTSGAGLAATVLLARLAARLSTAIGAAGAAAAGGGSAGVAAGEGAGTAALCGAAWLGGTNSELGFSSAVLSQVHVREEKGAG